MNVIVSNKQKNKIDNANIEAIKEITGLFSIDEVINNFKGYFYSKIIIDATGLINFAKEDVLRKLVDEIGAEKVVLLLPERPEPPQRFCDFLISLGIYSFSTNINDIINFLRKTSENDNLNNNLNQNNEIQPTSEVVEDKNNDNKVILGVRNVTLHAGSTSLIYMMKNHLEKNFKSSVECIEVNKEDFRYFNASGMISTNSKNINDVIKNSRSNIILVDLNDSNYNDLCDDIIYLVEPSTINVNRALSENRDVFNMLKGKKVILNKSPLTNDEVSIFSNESGIDIYFNIPYVNDRNGNNNIIMDFINKLGITSKSGRGLLGIFK